MARDHSDGDMSVRIMFFSDHFYPEPSAPAAHVYERSVLWVEQGHEVTVITSAPNFPEGKVFEGYQNRWRTVQIVKGVRVVRVKTFIAPNKGFLLRTADYMSYMVSAFVMALLERRPDVIVSTSPHLFVSVCGMASAWARRVTHVMEVRDLWPASIVGVGVLGRGLTYRLLERLELFLYYDAGRVIALTRSFVDDMVRRGVPAEKIDFVLSGANVEMFTPRPKDVGIVEALGLEAQFVVGYLGTLGLAHDLTNVLKAAAVLRDDPVTILFVGAGAAKESLEEWVAENGLSNVIFEARKLREEMPAYWSVCDASLIHLRDAEVFKMVVPSKIFESMAMGVPILYVGPEGEGSDIVREHHAGIVIPAGDPAALAQAINSLARDDQLRERLGRNGAEVASRFSRRTHADKTLRVVTTATK